jgi:hypothetical protein
MKDYPFIAQLIDEGYEVTLNDTGMGKKLVIVCNEGGHLIMFPRGRMSDEKVMAKLESYAQDLLENGMANDEINDTRYKIW